MRKSSTRQPVLPFWALLFVAGLAPSADAFADPSWVRQALRGCSKLVALVVHGGYEAPRPDAEETAAWNRFLAPDSDFPELPANFVQGNLFWHIASRMPPALLDRIGKIPPDSYRGRLYMDDLAQELRREYLPSSFLHNVLDAFDRADTSTRARGIDAWLRDGIAAYRNAVRESPSLEAPLRERHEQLLTQHRALRSWYGGFVVEVPYQTSGSRRIDVRIGRDTLRGLRVGNELHLDVPRRLIAHPAWNPLNEKNLIRMAGAGVQPPDVWDVALGHDGRFYLQDGNHRFELTGRDPVRVRMPFPPRTVPLRNFLDLWGITQPSLDQVIALHRGELSYADLLPPALRRELVLQPAEGPAPGNAAN